MTKMRHAIQNKFRAFLSALIVFNLVFPASVLAQIGMAEVEINQDLEFKSEGLGGLLSHGNLPKGSVIKIPEKFVLKDSDGKINSQLTLRNWINNGHLNKTEGEYYFRVSVAKDPSGKLTNHSGLMALQNLGITDGMTLIAKPDAPLIRDTPVVAEPTKPLNRGRPSTPGLFRTPVPSAPSAPKNQVAVPSTPKSQATSEPDVASCIGNSCREDTTFIAKLKKDMGRIFSQVRTGTERAIKAQRPGNTFDAVIRNFHNTCFGVNFNDFTQLVKQKASANGIPAEVLLGIMTKESAGRCHALGDTNLMKKSMGLFQINGGSSSVKTCSQSQLQQLKGKSLAQMESSSLRCLGNPVTNLSESIRIYKDHYRTVNNGKSPTATGAFSQLSELVADEHRKALAGYNGGSRWVERAEDDLQVTKNRHGRSSDKWEDLRYFWFRGALKSNGYAISNPSSGSRKQNLALSNMIYVESILGRSSAGEVQTGFVHYWEAQLGRPSNYVASK